jgi:DnaJ-class molecular chaperone
MIKKEEECKACSGTGIIIKQSIFAQEWQMDMGTREDDCEVCKGTGKIEN